MAISYDYDGRTVLVTGGTKGIGAGIASAFLAGGADVVVCARRPPERPPAAGDRAAWFVPADVRDPAQVESLIEAVAERYGRLDVVVNNAGGSPQVPAADASPGLHAKVIQLNLIAPLHVAQKACHVMRAQESGGSIVMIGSVSGVRPSPGTAAYGAAKAGLHHLAACLAAEWAPKIRVNSVVVGLADNGAAGEHYGGARTLARLGTTVPAGRLAEPADVAAACLFLGAPEAAYITGSTLTVDGGGERPAWSHIVAEAARVK